MVQSYISTFCGIAIAALFSGWGLGAMMAAIWKLRGQDASRIFWSSFVFYAILIITTWVVGVFGSDLLHIRVSGWAWLFLLLALYVFGLIVSPVVTLILRWSNPAVFKKPTSSLTTSASNAAVTPQTEPVLQKPQSLKAEADIPSRPFPIPAPAAPPPQKLGHIFVSYRRSDSADIAGRIYDRLVGKFGRDPIFKDVDSIPLGLDFKEYLDQKVSECDVLLAIIGDRWIDATDAAGKRRLEDPSDFVRIEIQSALERGIPVIPLLVREAHMPRSESLPVSLQKLVYRNGIPIRSDPDFHRDMDRLIAALERYMQPK